jgi:V8-like Glu-specific endopeptidase
MDDARFDAVMRRLGESVTRRGVLGVLAGVAGLGLSEAAGKRRSQRRRRNQRHSDTGRVNTEITNGVLDGNGHPYVGLMVAQDADGEPLWRCSGTLLSPTLFLTAGHCTEAPAAHVEIWFDTDVASGIPGNDYPNAGDVGGEPFIHPDYDPNAFYLFDLGVVVLDEPYVTSAYGELPDLNQLDGLAKKRGKQDRTFTAVGYGLQRSFPDAASWKNQEDRVRMVARPKLIQINTGYVGDYSLLLSNNAHTGGTCFGDSGGPNFIGTSNVIGGVTSFGKNGNCAGTGGVYRVDRADDLNWLNSEFGDQLK